MAGTTALILEKYETRDKGNLIQMLQEIQRAEGREVPRDPISGRNMRNGFFCPRVPALAGRV